MTTFKSVLCICVLEFDQNGKIVNIISQCGGHGHKIGDNWEGSDLQINHINPSCTDQMISDKFGIDVLNKFKNMKTKVSAS